MPRNEGIQPPLARVDIEYFCGVVVRNVDPSQREWSIEEPPFAFDIKRWQPPQVKD